MATRLSIAVLLVLLGGSLYARPELHTMFYFGMSDGQEYSTEQQADSKKLGSSQGWSCVVSAIGAQEKHRSSGDSGPRFTKSASIQCANETGMEASLPAVCEATKPDHGEGVVYLKSSARAVQVKVVIRCYTREQ